MIASLNNTLIKLFTGSPTEVTAQCDKWKADLDTTHYEVVSTETHVLRPETPSVLLKVVYNFH